MPFNHFIFSSLITAIATFSIGVFVLFKGRWKKLPYILFSLYSFSISLWSYSCTKFTPYFQDPHLIWGRLLHLGAILIPIFFVHFVFVFLGEKNRKIIILIYLIGGLFLFFNFFTRLFISGITNKTFYSYPTPSTIYPFYFMFFIICVIFGFYKLFKSLRSATGNRRNQIKYLLWSSLFGYIGGLKNFIIIVGLEIFPVYPYGTYAIPLYVLTVTYAIIKHHLLDINIALTRAGIFILVYLFVIGIPFLIGYKYKVWFHSTWLMFVLSTLGIFLYNHFRNQAERILRKQQLKYQEELIKFSSSMMLIKDLEKLLRTIVLSVVDIVKVEWAGVYLKDEKKPERFLPKVSGLRFQVSGKSA